MGKNKFKPGDKVKITGFRNLNNFIAVPPEDVGKNGIIFHDSFLSETTKDESKIIDIYPVQYEGCSGINNWLWAHGDDLEHLEDPAVEKVFKKLQQSVKKK